MGDVLIILLVGAGIAAGLFPLFILLLRKQAKPVDPDELPFDVPEVEDVEPEPLLGDLTGPLAAQMPMRPKVQSDLQRELIAAGFYHRTALSEYRAIRWVLILAPLFISGAAALLADESRMPRIVFIGCLL